MDTPQNTIPSENREPGPSWKALGVGLLVALAVGTFYVAAARQMSWWPYGVETGQNADWTTYTNAEYGFTVQHPQSWHSEECKDSGPGGTYVLAAFGDANQLVVCNSDAPFAGVIMIGVAPGMVSEQEIESTLDALDQSSRSSTTVDGVSATRIEGITKETEGPGPGAGMKYINIFTVQNGIVYRWVYLNEPSRVPEFEDVLKTFKFGQKVGVKNEEWETYYNTKYGFEIKLPKTWKGYTVTTESYPIQDIASDKNYPPGVQIRLRYPYDTVVTPHADMPIMVFSKENWSLVQQGKISVGAAPVPPSKLGENSVYVLALPARYNYDFAPGWEEVDELVHTLVAFEPTG